MRAPSRRPTEQSAHAHLPGRGRVVFFQSGRPLRRAERVEIDTGESGCLHSGSCGDGSTAACPALLRLIVALTPRQRGASSALPCSITCRCIPCHLLCRYLQHMQRRSIPWRPPFSRARPRSLLPSRLRVGSDARSFTVPAVRARFAMVALFISCLGRNLRIDLRAVRTSKIGVLTYNFTQKRKALAALRNGPYAESRMRVGKFS